MWPILFWQSFQIASRIPRISIRRLELRPRSLAMHYAEKTRAELKSWFDAIVSDIWDEQIADTMNRHSM